MRYRHIKRGTEYEMLGVGKMQAQNWIELLWTYDPQSDEAPKNTWSLLDNREVVLYRSLSDGSLWVRPKEEFFDGRFEEIATTNKPLAERLQALGERYAHWNDGDPDAAIYQTIGDEILVELPPAVALAAEKARADEAEARCDTLAGALRDAKDNGLVYWEPNTQRGHVVKAQMLARIDAALATIPAKPATEE